MDMEWDGVPLWAGLEIIWPGGDARRVGILARYVQRVMQPYMPLGALRGTWEAWWASCRGEPEGVIERCVREAIQEHERSRP